MRSCSARFDKSCVAERRKLISIVTKMSLTRMMVHNVNCHSAPAETSGLGWEKICFVNHRPGSTSAAQDPAAPSLRVSLKQRPVSRLVPASPVHDFIAGRYKSQVPGSTAIELLDTGRTRPQQVRLVSGGGTQCNLHNRHLRRQEEGW